MLFIFKQISYLNILANRFARWLKKQGVSTGCVVAVLLEPGIDFVTSVLAAIKLGASYLPIDSSAPPARIQKIILESRPTCLICSSPLEIKGRATAQHLIKKIHLESIMLSSQNLLQSNTASALYTMYTSGTTGTPKGIVIPHHAIINLMKIENDQH